MSNFYAVDPRGRFWRDNYFYRDNKIAHNWELCEDEPLMKAQDKVTFYKKEEKIITSEGLIYDPISKMIINDDNPISMIIRDLILMENGDLISSGHDQVLLKNVKYIGSLVHRIIILIDDRWMWLNVHKEFRLIALEGDIPTGELIHHQRNILRTTDGYWSIDEFYPELTCISNKINVDNAISVINYYQSGVRLAMVLTSDNRLLIHTKDKLIDNNTPGVKDLLSNERLVELHYIDNAPHGSDLSGKLYKLDHKAKHIDKYPQEMFKPITKGIKNSRTRI